MRQCQQADPRDIVCFSLSLLCSNAGKFTNSGEVRVTVAVVKMPGSSRRSLAGTPVGATPPGSSSKMISTRVVGEDVVPPPPLQQDTQSFLCVTISNARSGAPLERPEECFIPFKLKGAGVCMCECVMWLPPPLRSH